MQLFRRILSHWERLNVALKSSALLGGLLNIFANSTIISPQRAKHASVCLLMLHIKERFCRSLSSTGEGKHSLYCADLSLSPYFIPPLPGPRKDSLTLSPRNKLGGLGTTHRAARGSFPAASPPRLPVFFMIALYRSYFCLPPSVTKPHLLSAQAGRGGGNAACPLFHISLCAPAPCLFECADVNCREDGHLA